MTEKVHDISVGMGEMGVAADGGYLTMILGSCVAVLIHDPILKITGAIHAMLPSPPTVSGNSGEFKFVDTGIRGLLREMVKRGSLVTHLRAKLTGGANMFPKLKQAELGNLGVRNVEAARFALAAASIKIEAEDVGGITGRSVVAHSQDFKVQIKRSGETITI